MAAGPAGADKMTLTVLRHGSGRLRWLLPVCLALLGYVTGYLAGTDLGVIHGVHSICDGR